MARGPGERLAIERQLRDLREGVMRVRLVPVGEIFRRMPFVVRDLARETGKQVELDISGQDTEIDKFLIERMLDPVLHLVRNAVSHGIESRPMSAARPASRGRPPSPSAHRASATWSCSKIADDGRGVDAGAVAARARAQGLAVPDGPLDARRPARHPLRAGILDPRRGRSRQRPRRRHGRRADRRARARRHARRSIPSPGRARASSSSCRSRWRSPTRSSRALAAQTFAVPQIGGAGSDRGRRRDRPARSSSNEIAPYRDGSLPLVRLADVFGSPRVPGRSLHVFVVGHGPAAVGLAVDRIVGQREIVVRTLADALVKVDGVVGATDLGDGRVVLILDARASRRSLERGARRMAAAGRVRT